MLAGRATFTVGGEHLDAPAGTLVFLPEPATRRGAVADEDGTTVLAVGFPGRFRVFTLEQPRRIVVDVAR